MTIETRRFVKRPLYVDAIQVTAKNMTEVAQWCGGTIQQDAKAKSYIKVNVLRPVQVRQGQGYVGDWILETESGYKVYGDKAFKKDFTISVEQNNPQAVKLLENIFTGGIDNGDYTIEVNSQAVAQINESNRRFMKDLTSGEHGVVLTDVEKDLYANPAK